jgi:Protein of unknown function (DUF2809)
MGGSIKQTAGRIPLTIPSDVATRRTYVAMALGTIAVGLVVHTRGNALGAVARDVVGDALWAAMMFWWISSVVPRSSRPARVAIALLVCAAVEVSQLSHASLLMTLRETRLGALVLGTGFDSRDLVSYTCGVAVAAIIDTRLLSRTRRSQVQLQ